MKKFLLIILCLATWQVTTAQEASFGIKVGLATNSLNLDVESEVTANGTDYKIAAGDTKVGFHAGFMSRFNFGGLLLMPELYFSSTDTCVKLPAIFNIRTDLTLPVDYGTTVEIYCIPGYSLVGDSAITCVNGREFSYVEVPSCVLGETLQ